VTYKRYAATAIPFALLLLFLASPVHAQGEAFSDSDAAAVFLGLVVVLLAAKLSSVVERFGQPLVLGELAAGVVLGNVALFGIDVFEPLKSNLNLAFLAKLGVVILLFQVGLESNLQDMRRVGVRALLVACVGVVVPFLLGTWLVGPLILPGLSTNFYLFLGATLTATSVGITARVFKDLGKLQMPEAQIVLGAAVIDDVLGLIILAVVAAIVTAGTVSAETVFFITLKAALFLAGAIIVGQMLAPRLGRLFSRIHTGIGMKLTLAISFGLVMAYLAQQIGLSPIVGAFAAGLVLEPVHFRDFDCPSVVSEVRACMQGADAELRAYVLQVVEHHAERHVEQLVEPIAIFLVPVFFVLTGMAVKLDSFLNVPILLLALGLTVVAFVGKLVAGLAAGKVNKWIVGWGMVPRGEVGLIFAAMGQSMGVMSDEIFSALVIVIILSTLLTPPILTVILRRQPPPGAAVSKEPVLVLTENPQVE
jgi:Kef-type K+ transport system membrane component KefB